MSSGDSNSSEQSSNVSQSASDVSLAESTRVPTKRKGVRRRVPTGGERDVRLRERACVTHHSTLSQALRLRKGEELVLLRLPAQLALDQLEGVEVDLPTADRAQLDGDSYVIMPTDPHYLGSVRLLPFEDENGTLGPTSITVAHGIDVVRCNPELSASDRSWRIRDTAKLTKKRARPTLQPMSMSRKAPVGVPEESIRRMKPKMLSAKKDSKKSKRKTKLEESKKKKKSKSESKPEEEPKKKSKSETKPEEEPKKKSKSETKPEEEPKKKSESKPEEESKKKKSKSESKPEEKSKKKKKKKSKTKTEEGAKKEKKRRKVLE